MAASWECDDRSLGYCPKPSSFKDEDFGKVLKDIALSLEWPWYNNSSDDEDDINTCNDTICDNEDSCDCKVCCEGILYDDDYEPRVCIRYCQDGHCHMSAHNSQASTPRSSYSEDWCGSEYSSGDEACPQGASPNKKFFYT